MIESTSTTVFSCSLAALFWPMVLLGNVMQRSPLTFMLGLISDIPEKVPLRLVYYVHTSIDTSKKPYLQEAMLWLAVAVVTGKNAELLV